MVSHPNDGSFAPKQRLIPAQNVLAPHFLRPESTLVQQILEIIANDVVLLEKQAHVTGKCLQSTFITQSFGNHRRKTRIRRRRPKSAQSLANKTCHIMAVCSVIVQIIRPAVAEVTIDVSEAGKANKRTTQKLSTCSTIAGCASCSHSQTTVVIEWAQTYSAIPSAICRVMSAITSL